MRTMLTAITLLFLVGCANNNQKIAERVESWKVVTSSGISSGADQHQIEKWAKEKGIELTHSKEKNTYSALLETLPGDGLVCAEWHILLNIEIDSYGKVKNHNVSSAGRCL